MVIDNMCHGPMTSSDHAEVDVFSSFLCPRCTKILSCGDLVMKVSDILFGTLDALKWIFWTIACFSTYRMPTLLNCLLKA